MKKLVILTTTFILSIVAFNASAQNGKINLGLNASTSHPLGDNKDMLNSGWDLMGHWTTTSASVLTWVSNLDLDP